MQALDLIAVLALLKRIGAPKAHETRIAADPGHGPGSVTMLFLRGAVGGALFGLVAGSIVPLLIKSIDHYLLEIFLALALVAGGYAAAQHLHVSGPIAMVVAGLLIGNQGCSFAMSPTTIDQLDRF